MFTYSYMLSLLGKIGTVEAGRSPWKVFRGSIQLEHTDIRHVHIHTDVQSGLYKSLNLLRSSIENCEGVPILNGLILDFIQMHNRTPAPDYA